MNTLDKIETDYYSKDNYKNWLDWLICVCGYSEYWDSSRDDDNLGYRRLSLVFLVRLFGVELTVIKPRHKDHGYSCTCSYNPPETPYYIDDEGRATSPERSYHIHDTLCHEIPEGKEIYPKYTNFEHSAYAAMEFGGTHYDWDETHYCPFCKAEFTFNNSSY